ncbi:broad specificity phosphatase PhoE [Flavobacterium arsenatis]|uniref:Broad specificity phosphatase PhoE n=1 Tax=Flavobacterium arsenatis TaxID=1484332 RepID=A0ABU1TQM4_9FLAO|nr:phosphoglycerate mutase family protein [Flavobacterium arsenatis]MDR6968249.1 broad specificity phosphatase PhoE [Flavobacterium arsenatis]
MKKICIILMGLFFQSMNAQSETTIYLIRHAEKADSSPNTALSAEGKERAENWAIFFKDTPIDFFYSTSYLRTESTCLPIAVSKQKQIISYNPKEINLKKMIAENQGKTILIVGHSNTIPKHINQLLDEEKYPEIPESEFGNLYTIKIKNGVISHTLTKP